MKYSLFQFQGFKYQHKIEKKTSDEQQHILHIAPSPNLFNKTKVQMLRLYEKLSLP